MAARFTSCITRLVEHRHNRVLFEQTVRMQPSLSTLKPVEPQIPRSPDNIPPSSTLSIAIITRNEANNVARAIESALRAIKDCPGTEILLVDSASTDGTVEIAQRYPINIVRLKPGWFLSVPAGRHIGMQYSHGDFILHMDGDMELDPDWVNRSVDYLSENPLVGAVGGYYRNIYLKDGKISGEQDIHKDKLGKIQEVRYVAGAALYRRTAIDAMGGFQPYIRGEESVYVSMGIRNAGYKVIQLPVMMSRHYCLPPNSFAYAVRRLKLDMWLGFGQVPRYYLGTRLFWLYLKERGTYLVYLASVLVSIISLFLSVITRNPIYFAGWLLIVSTFLGLFVIKKRSFRKTFISLLTHTGIAISAVRGFFRPPLPSSAYPLDVEIIQLQKPIF